MAGESRKLREEVQDEEPGISMTPMIDIVFQLLIFFMLACRFRTEEGEIHALLPKWGGQGITTPDKVPIEELRIKLLWVEPGSFRETKDPSNGRTLLKVGHRNLPYVTNSFGEVVPDYDELYKIICISRDTFKPTRQFRTRPATIDARPLVPLKHVVSSLNECVRANIKDITFAKPEIEY